MQSIPVPTPSHASPRIAFSRTPPTPGQEAIDLAMRAFRIALPDGVTAPAFAAELEDRGLTSWDLWTSRTWITIGPAAFESWALLGSTLAHEAEVHGRQNRLAISVKETLGIDAVVDAEKEAYGYEIANAARFGLSSAEQERIAATLAGLASSR